MGQTAFPYTAVRGLPAKTLAARNAATAGPLQTISWAAASTGDVLTVQGDGTVAFAAVSAGIGSLNGLTDATQTFAVGTTGTDVAFSSAAGVHTLNIPDASATARGLVTTGTQAFGGIKRFAAADIRLGTGGNDYRISVFGTTLLIDNNTGTDTQFRQAAAGTQCSMSSNLPHFRTISLSVGSGTAGQAILESRAAHVLEQRSSTSAQRYEVYNTYTSSTSFERLNIAWATNICTIEVTAGSGGGTLRGLQIGGASTSLLGFYGATPVDRPDTIADPAGGGTIDAEARTAINTIIDRLQELGLIA
jgi:hypothetical protein